MMKNTMSFEQEIFAELMLMVETGTVEIMMDDEGELYFKMKE